MGKEIHYERIKGVSMYIPKCKQNENAIRLLSLCLHKDVHEDGSVTAYYESDMIEDELSYLKRCNATPRNIERKSGVILAMFVPGFKKKYDFLHQSSEPIIEENEDEDSEERKPVEKPRQSTVLDRVVSYGHAGLRYGGAY